MRAGPLVKELRMIRPRFFAGDSWEARREKEWILDFCSLNRSPADKLELRMALFGWDGVHYRLSFDDRYLPGNYAGVQKEMSLFFLRCRRWRQKQGWDRGFDYIRCIEGLHGDHRWHVHMVVSSRDFSQEDIAALWGRGDVFCEDVLLDCTGYRRLARYFLKERMDGLLKPLDKRSVTCSASLAIPEARCSLVKSGRIRMPADAICVQEPSAYSSRWGSFNYCKYLLPDKSRACARARSILQ